MKLVIKSLKQVVYPVEVESDQVDVLELKKQIEKAHQFDHLTINLVFNGSKLVDAKKLCEYNIKEENVIIMMSSKAKPVNVNVAPQEEAKKEEKVDNKPSVAQTNVSTPQQQQPVVPAQPKPKKDYTNEVKMLTDMGFPKSESETAVNAARGNIDVAIEFLSTGIPENLPNEEEFEAGESQSVSSALKNIASLVKILCQNDPSKFQNILLGLQQSSPEIVELIQENEAEFKELIQSPITEEDIRNFQALNQSVQMGGLGGMGMQEGQAQAQGRRGQGQAGEFVLRLTKEEFEAVNRLKELGFNEREAVQAFIACDKNEEFAANFLMENRIREQEEELNIDYSSFGNPNPNPNPNPNANPNPNNSSSNQQGGNSANQDSSSGNQGSPNLHQNPNNQDISYVVGMVAMLM